MTIELRNIVSMKSRETVYVDDILTRLILIREPLEGSYRGKLVEIYIYVYRNQTNDFWLVRYWLISLAL